MLKVIPLSWTSGLTLYQAGMGMGQFDHGTIYLSKVSTEVGLGSPELVNLFLSLFDLSQKDILEKSFSIFFENWTLKLFGVLKLGKKIKFD